MFKANTLPVLIAAAATIALSFPAVANAKLDLFSDITEVDSAYPAANAKREELRAAESGLSAAKQQRPPTLSVLTSKSATVNACNIYLPF